MNIKRDGPTIELQITEDSLVTLYCRNRTLAIELEDKLRQAVLGSDVQISLKSDLILNFDDQHGLAVEKNSL